jgi:hypothetical protein
LPFPVKKGNLKTTKEIYRISGLPSLAVLVDGEVKQVFRGAQDIRDARAIITAFRQGAQSV